jgi:hypothetical protein
MTTDFAGLNGFVWWTGVVEDRQDPLKLGRCRVRIIGWHDADVNLIPIEALPWAQIIQSPTGPRTFGSIKEGEWVSGFFLDGQNAQEPVIFGVYPGIISQGIRTIESPIPQLGFSDRRTSAQIAAAPKLPDGVVAEVKGEPSLPPTARGKVEGTGIDISNNSQAHVCDITSELRKDAALARLEFSQLMGQIRKAIRALIAALGLEPSGEVSKAISLAKALLRELKYIQDILQEISDLKTVLLDYARKVSAMIQYILSLPAKLLALLADCLQNFASAVGSLLGDIITIPGLESMGASTDITELLNTLDEIGTTTKSIVQSSVDIITIPAQLVVAVVTPASASDIAASANTISSFVSSSTNSTTVVSTNTYSSATTRLP